MTTTLVAIGFRDQTTATAAAVHVHRLAPDIVLDADAVAVMTRDDDGVIQVTTRHQVIDQGRSASIRGVFWLPLFTALCFAPLLQAPVGGEWLALQRKIAGTGLVDDLREPVLDMLQPGSSIVFLAVGPTTPLDAVTGIQEHFGGTAARAQLSEQQMCDINEAFHGRSETFAQD